MLQSFEIKVKSKIDKKFNDPILMNTWELRYNFYKFFENFKQNDKLT